MDLPYDWSGCEWLGVESFFAPSHEPKRNVLGGLVEEMAKRGVELLEGAHQ